jgi:acyl carrier protein
MPGAVKPDDELFSGRTGFDSFSLMELVLRLEDTFDLSIPDEDLDLAIFQSVRSIASYIKARLGKEL